MNHNQTVKNSQSVLGMLRALVPRRQLSYSESLLIAELQANRLLEHFAIDFVASPDELVTELPRIKVEREPDLPASGSAHWNGQQWIITLNSTESQSRQRFSLMHEAKHVIDHTTKGFLYRDSPASSAHEQAERVADYFAAYVLMPKRVVKRLWCAGPQSVEALAARLQVSPAALRYRLDQLGLTERPGRCERLGRAQARSRDRFVPALRPELAGAST
jgi:Zn-dependent peptidase ImmA (M78 family)